LQRSICRNQPFRVMTTFSIRLFPVCHLRIGTRRCPIAAVDSLIQSDRRVMG